MSNSNSISPFNSEKGSVTPQPPTPSKAKSVYRSAFAALKMRITEGFLQHEPALHLAIKVIITPTPCIPLKLKEGFIFQVGLTLVSGNGRCQRFFLLH